MVEAGNKDGSKRSATRSRKKKEQQRREINGTDIYSYGIISESPRLKCSTIRFIVIGILLQLAFTAFSCS